MWETLRFEHFKSPSTFLSDGQTHEVFIVKSYFSGGAGQVPLPVCFLHRGGAGCGPQCVGPLPGRGPQVLTLTQSIFFSLPHFIYRAGTTGIICLMHFAGLESHKVLAFRYILFMNYVHNIYLCL